MLHPTTIASKVAEAESQHHVKLIEYPVEDSLKLTAHFKSLEHTDGKRIWYARDSSQSPEQFSFVEWEAAYVQNELMMCACSFPYFFFRYFVIRHHDGHIGVPNLRAAQLIFLAILADMDRAGLPMLLLILKARQL